MNLYHAFLKKLAHFQVEHPYMSVLLILSLTVAIYGGISSVRTVASLEQMMPRDVEEIKAFNTLRDNNMGQDIIAIVLEIDRDSTGENGVVDVRDRMVYDYITHLQESVRSNPDVLRTYSYADLISDPAEYETLIRDPSVKPYLSNYINSDSSITIIMATTDVSADDPRMAMLSQKIMDDVSSAGRPAGITIKYTGTPIIQQRLGELIAKDRANTRWISTFLVFLITMIIFGTFTSALVPIAVVTISVTWLYGTMGYTNLPISTLAGGVAAMVIGIGIDFAIHIMNKFKYERRAGASIKHAVENAVVHTGSALTATSMTTIVAFLAFLVGAMPEMGRFGMLMAIGIAYSLLFSLFGLPALLIIEEKCVAYVRRRIRFGVEGELKLRKVRSDG